MAEGDLIKSEAMQIAIIKFYVAVFIFYSDAIGWYNSSAVRKVWHSLDSDFSSQFKNPLENIKRLGSLIRRTATHGSGAELRVTRLEIEDMKDDLRAGREGVERYRAEVEKASTILQERQGAIVAHLERLTDKANIDALAEMLWRKVGLNGTALLLEGLREAPITSLMLCAEDFNTAVSSSGSVQFISKTANNDLSSEIFPIEIANLSAWIELVLYSIVKGVRLTPVNNELATFDDRLGLAIRRWMGSQKSTLLYLESRASFGMSTQVSMAAARIIKSAAELKIPVISFFCSYSAFDSEEAVDHMSRNESPVCDPFMGMLHSLTFQILSQLPPLDKISVPEKQVLSEKPDVTIMGWRQTLDLLQVVLAASPPLLLCVIDSLQVFEQGYAEQIRAFVNTLKLATQAPNRITKILFTNSLRAHTLVQQLSVDQLAILEGTRRPALPGGASPGRVRSIF